jgi:hypothetical protein
MRDTPLSYTGQATGEGAPNGYSAKHTLRSVS